MTSSFESFLVLVIVVVSARKTKANLFSFVHHNHIANHHHHKHQNKEQLQLLNQQNEEEEKIQHHGKVQQHDTAKTPFQIFEDCVKRRIDIADTYLPAFSNNCEEKHQQKVDNTLDGNIGFVSLEELRNLTTTTTNRASLSQKQMQEKQKRRKEIMRKISQCGGCIMIQLSSLSSSENNDKEKDVQILEQMWSSMHSLFEKQKQEKSIELPFRHQTLARSSSSSSDEKGTEEEIKGGYSYLETSRLRTNQTLVPSLMPHLELGKVVGGEDVAAIQSDAYSLLLEISQLLSILVLAGSKSTTDDNGGSVSFATNNVDIEEAYDLIQRIGDDGSDIQFPNETDVSCTVHRLCLYASSSDATTNKTNRKNEFTTISDITEKKETKKQYETTKEAEYIRSHTDWSILTLVPVSAVFGLEIWKNKIDGWIRPELLARRQYEKNQQEEPTSGGEQSNEDSQWNSNYVVAMAGKWLEILSNGEIPATVHRVAVSDKGSANAELKIEQAVHEEGTEKEQVGTREISPKYQTKQQQQRMSAPFFWRPRQRISLDIQSVFNSDNNDENDSNNDNDYVRALTLQQDDKNAKINMETLVTLKESDRKIVNDMNHRLKTTYC